jgi:hypothetical protein
MRESILAEIPHQKGYGVLATAEVAGDVDVVVVCVARRRTSLESTLEDYHLAINPEPIFAVDGYVGKGTLVA